MKGATRTKAHKSYHNAMARLGCIACYMDGWYNDYVSIHHIDGRTKPHAHWLVIPLCAGHHQDGTGNDKSMVAVHPYKRQFEDRYAHQFGLYQKCVLMLKDMGYDFEKMGWKEVDMVNTFYEVTE